MANEAFVGKQFGLSELKSSLSGLTKSGAFSWGASSGVFELLAGGSKLKAVIESIKWAAFARAGVAGFAAVVPMAYALVTGIRKAVTESGILQAALNRISTTKVLTTQFTSFLGSVTLARQRVGELYAFVANSKFNMGEASGASRVLTILTNGAEGGIGSLRVLGAVAHATGNSLQELALYYGKFSEQSRKGEDISGTVEQLKEMGVLSESTANKLVNLQRSGASASQMMTAFRDSIASVAAKGGSAGDSVEELQDKIEKLKQSAAEGFGKAWMDQEQRDLENQVKLWTALSGAAERFGTNLEGVTGSATKLKNTLYDVTGTDFFKTGLKTLADMIFTLPVAIGLYSTLKTMMKGGVPGSGMFAGLKDASKVLINPAAAARSQAAKLARMAAGIAEEVPAAGGAGLIQTLRGGAATVGAKGFEGLAASLRAAGTGFLRLGGFASRAIPFVAVVTTVAYAGAKAWDWYRDRVERAARAAGLVKDAMATREALAAQIAGIKTLDDKTRALAQARQLLNEATEKQAAMRGDLKSTTDEEAGAAQLVVERRRAVRAIQDVNEANLGLTQKEFDYRLRQVDIELQIAEIQHNAQMSRANAVEREVLANKRLVDIRKQLTEHQARREAQPGLDAAQATIEQERKDRRLQARGYKDQLAALSQEARDMREQISTADYGKTGAASPALLQRYNENIAQQQDLQKRISSLQGPSAREKAAEEARRNAIRQGSSEYNLLMQRSDEARGKGDERGAQDLQLQAARLVARREDELKVQAAELEAGRPEREAAAKREVRDRDATTRVRKMMDESTVLVAQGNYALAGATRKSAQDLQDRTDDQNRLSELILQNGGNRAKAEAQLAEEVTARTRGRAAAREARVTTATRGITESELELQSRGVLPGKPGARGELIKMQDVDAFMNNFKDMTEGLGELTADQTKQFSDLALKRTSLDILSSQNTLPGAGQIADSMAQLGLGGGVYAGVGGDPQLQAQKRIGDLTEQTNKILQNVEKKLNLGVL